MKVLHYNLGTPPYRSGGLTAWSMDLMSWQASHGIDVLLMYPSEIQLMKKKITIKTSKPFKGIPVFRLINPLPIPLIYDIDSTEHYLNYDKNVDFYEFFDSEKIDVIHLHTFMGIPIELMKQAKEKNIRIIYTAHDTFGVWPEPDLGSAEMKVDPVFNQGYIGRQSTLKYSSIVLAQSRIYQALKHNVIVRGAKNLLKKMRTSQANGADASDKPDKLMLSKYRELRSVYKEYFKLIDEIHYNSLLTQDIFKAYGIKQQSFVSEVYHSYIPIKPVDSGAPRTNGKLKILYNGTQESYKGFNLLLSVLDDIYSSGVNNFELVVYGESNVSRSYMVSKKPYNHASLTKVYGSVDLTIVPSLYYETYGMVVPESLAHGVPVIASNHVGAKSLLVNGEYGSIFKTRSELKRYIREAITNPDITNRQRVAILNSNILRFDVNATYATVSSSYKGLLA